MRESLEMRERERDFRSNRENERVDMQQREDMLIIEKKEETGEQEKDKRIEK